MTQPNPMQTLAQDLAETQQALGREIVAGRRAAMRAAELTARLAAAEREIERLRAEAAETTRAPEAGAPAIPDQVAGDVVLLPRGEPAPAAARPRPPPPGQRAR